MKVLVAVFGVFIVQGILGCLPTSENNPSAAYPECACSKPEFITLLIADAGYSTQQTSPDDCKTFTYVCNNPGADAGILPNPVTIYYNGKKVEYTETLKRIEVTCDPTTRTYSAEGHTGLTTLACSLGDLESLGAPPEEIAELDAAAAGSGAAGAIGACGSCDPKKVFVQGGAQASIVTTKISADCNTITWTCEGTNISWAVNGVAQNVQSPPVVVNGDTVTVTATCDGNGNYFVDSFDQPIRAFVCLSSAPAGK